MKRNYPPHRIIKRLLMQSITTSVLARILLSALFALSFTMSVCAQTTVNAPSISQTGTTGTVPSKSQTSAASTKTKVACVGDSLTRGYLLEDAQSYPAQLQQLLGAQYEVMISSRVARWVDEYSHLLRSRMPSWASGMAGNSIFSVDNAYP